MVDPEIHPGDVCFDLTQGSKVQVVERVADSVAEHREREDFDLATYKSHPLHRVSDDEPVFKCVFLRSEVGVPSKSYDFPESRLARVPVEEANEDLARVQDALVTNALATILAESMQHHADWAEFRKSLLFFAGLAGVGDDLLANAHELARAETGEGDSSEVLDAHETVAEYREERAALEGGDDDAV